jgi:hypothetical protein
VARAGAPDIIKTRDPEVVDAKLEVVVVPVSDADRRSSGKSGRS